MKPLIIVTSSVLIFFACSGKKEGESQSKPVLKPEVTEVRIATYGMDIQMEDTLKSGLNHLVYENKSTMTHFLIFNKVPENIGRKEYHEELSLPFQEVLDAINEGTEPPGDFPEWLGEMVNMGGVGLTSAGETSESYVDLEPGNYIVECYIKSGGIFHSTTMMLKQVTVESSQSETSPPSAQIILKVDSNGIAMEGQIPENGDQVIFQVDYGPKKLFPNFTGPDVHLAKIDDETNIEALKDYMDWTKPNGMVQASPALFLGGVQDAPEGKTAYFAAKLVPGKYALLGEVPDPTGSNFYMEFELR